MWLMVIYRLSCSGSDVTPLRFEAIQEEKLSNRFVRTHRAYKSNSSLFLFCEFALTD